MSKSPDKTPDDEVTSAFAVQEFPEQDERKRLEEAAQAADAFDFLADHDELGDDWLNASLADDEPETIGILGSRRKPKELRAGARRKRLSEMLSIVRRYDILHGMTPETLRQMFEELGPTFVKAGQILSMRSEILPQSFCDELAHLRTNAEPMDRDVVLQVLRDEYAAPIEEIFDAIDDVPLGSASIAQVHKARLVTGELVAVKVQRPHVQEIMAQDISIMRSVGRFLSHFVSASQIVDIKSVIDELWRTFREETDFLIEARNLAEFRRCNRDCVFVDAPKPYPPLCTSHVVVMDYVEGIPISDVDTLKREGYDLHEIGVKLLDNFTTQMLDEGFFHADPHPGNIIIRGGKICYIDLGFMGRLSVSDRAAIQQMVIAVAELDTPGLMKGLLRFASSDSTGVDRGALLADLDAIVETYGTASLEELDVGEFFNALVSMATKHGIEMPGSVTILARTLVSLEGLVDTFLPGSSMIEILRDHIKAHESIGTLLGDESKLLARETRLATHGMLGAASEAGLLVRMATRGQLRVGVDMSGDEDMFSGLSHVADRLAMAIIVAGLFIGSSVVYFARIQPVIFGIPVIGFVGYVAALVLAVFVIRDILKR